LSHALLDKPDSGTRNSGFAKALGLFSKAPYSHVMLGAMSTIFRLPITVPSSAIDRLGHVNNVVYVQWMQDAAVSHSNHVGCTRLTQEAGASWVARTHQIEYLRPAFAGEEIHVLTWVGDFRKVRSTRKYKFVRTSDEVVLATAATDWVYVNLETGKPLSIPASIQELFTVVGARGDAEGTERGIAAKPGELA
jgi:acyl-CoA thioester hydrolase